MREKAEVHTKIDEVLLGLLFGLPPGILSGCVWVVYVVWMFAACGQTPFGRS
jgi:hypothetical protein